MAATTSRPAFAALRSANFRSLWIGLFISNAGTQMQTAGLYWLVLDLTGSTVQLGLVSLSFALPMILLPFLGGTVADRYDRVTLLKLTRLGTLLLTVLLAWLTIAGLIQ
ncbi:MAG TPA: MFS transporter, partial [Dehalococcoidia bacterium]|nr:MFS transporter [Dehalococcoidia bacterium]